MLENNYSICEHSELFSHIKYCQ